tara:strand:- start:100 stop:810 length:711 start_codon:yes stop_codon:yes gene_type:complete
MNKLRNQPIVLLGGFLITDEAYLPIKKWVKTNMNLELNIVNVRKIDWLLTNWYFGWRKILNRVDKEVQRLKSSSPTGKVTLIGHSSGGVMLRLYLGDKSTNIQAYNGLKDCNILITLGSPHQAIRATKLRAMVDKMYPGNFYSKEVTYISVAGDLALGSNIATSFSKKSAGKSYKAILGNEFKTGDGLVPIESALLKGSNKIILNDTAHSKFFGKYWYCSEERIQNWWDEANKLLM